MVLHFEKKDYWKEKSKLRLLYPSIHKSKLILANQGLEVRYKPQHE